MPKHRLYNYIHEYIIVLSRVIGDDHLKRMSRFTVGVTR